MITLLIYDLALENHGSINEIITRSNCASYKVVKTDEEISTYTNADVVLIHASNDIDDVIAQAAIAEKKNVILYSWGSITPQRINRLGNSELVRTYDKVELTRRMRKAFSNIGNKDHVCKAFLGPGKIDIVLNILSLLWSISIKWEYNEIKPDPYTENEIFTFRKVCFSLSGVDWSEKEKDESLGNLIDDTTFNTDDKVRNPWNDQNTHLEGPGNIWDKLKEAGTWDEQNTDIAQLRNVLLEWAIE